MTNWIVSAISVALLLSGCDKCSDDPQNPPIDIVAPDGKHVARVAVAFFSGFRVDPIFQVRIRTVSEDATSGTIVFETTQAEPRVEWIDADHLSITLTSVEIPNQSLHDANGVMIRYQLDPALTDKRIRYEYKQQLDRLSSGEVKRNRSWYQNQYNIFVEWAEKHAGFRPLSDRPVWEP